MLLEDAEVPVPAPPSPAPEMVLEQESSGASSTAMSLLRAALSPPCSWKAAAISTGAGWLPLPDATTATTGLRGRASSQLAPRTFEFWKHLCQTRGRVEGCYPKRPGVRVTGIFRVPS